METSIVINTLTDGSETFDVVFFDGSQKVVISATSEMGADRIQGVLAHHAEFATIEIATIAEVSG